MVDIYTNPGLYDSIHHDYEWDKRLIRSIAKNTNGSVLELASGTGRLTQTILDLGLDYTGLDSSKPFLEQAKTNYGNRADFILGDMRNFDLEMQFDLIFIGFNSFLHNLTFKDAKNCLSCVRKHLSNNGEFLLSIFVPDPIFLYREKNKLFQAMDLFQYEKSQCRVMEKNHYDSESQINELTWIIERDGKLDMEEYQYRMRMYYPHEMDILLSENGFIIREKLGDYDGTPMTDESHMQVYVCRSN